MGIPPAPGPFGPGPPQPARLSRPTRRGAPRLLPPYAPCHALWSLPPSSGSAAAAPPRALRASGSAAALRAWQTSPYRDHCDLRMGYPLSCSQILSSSALQRGSGPSDLHFGKNGSVLPEAEVRRTVAGEERLFFPD